MPETNLKSPRIENRPALQLAGLLERYSMKKEGNLGEQWHRFVPQIEQLPGKGGKVAYGAVFHPGKTDEFDYLTCIEIADLGKVNAKFATRVIPASKYAIFAHNGHVTEIKDAIGAIWNQWLPTSGFRPAGEKAGGLRLLERYGEGFNPDTGRGDIEIWVPIQ